MISAFPWNGLPRVAAAEMRAVNQGRRAFPNVNTSVIASAASGLLGHPVTIELRRRAYVDAQTLDFGTRGSTVFLEMASSRIAVEAEAELVLAAVSALSGGSGEVRVARKRMVEGELAGAWAGVAQFLARQSVSTDAVLCCVDPKSTEIAAVLGSDRALVFYLVVHVGALKTAVRVAVATPSEAVPSSQTLSHFVSAKRALDAWGDAPLTLHAVIATSIARGCDVALLRQGDVLLIDTLKLTTDCTLTTASGDRGIECKLLGAEDSLPSRRGSTGESPTGWTPGWTKLQIGDATVSLASEHLPTDDVAAMSGPTETLATQELPSIVGESAVAEMLAQMPVVVRVEAGSVTLAAREWATLGTGDVVSLDRRVGDCVVLRVGGVAVGRGELVDVEGVLGVRLLERLGAA